MDKALNVPVHRWPSLTSFKMLVQSDLPDAVPGEVALHVEWTDCPTCGGSKHVRGMNHDSPAEPLYPCPTCQTPPAIEGDGPIVEVNQ